MLNKFTAISLLLSNICFAQSKIEYANFIQNDTSIKWAAVYSSYINFTPVNPNFNLRNFYVNKLKQQGATAFLQDSSSFSVTPYKLNYDEYKASIKAVNYDATKMNWFFNYDEKFNVSEKIFTQESNTCDTCKLSNRISLFKVNQLLYYRNNQLKIQNILLSPVIYKKEAGATKETTTYFETSNFAFNEIKNADAPLPATAKFIGRSCNDLILLPSQKNNMMLNQILTSDNWSLSRLLYDDMKKQKLKAYATDKSIYPNQKQVLDPRKLKQYKAQFDYVMIYDSTGKVFPPQKIMRELNLDSLYTFTLIQDFYFDFEKELLYSKLIALVARQRIITSQGVYLGLADYWGVIFPPEKKDIVKKKK